MQKKINHKYPIINNDTFMDSILLEMKNILENLFDTILLEFKVDIVSNNDITILYINNIKINSFDFNLELDDKKSYYFKNTITYLINDYVDVSSMQITFFN